MIKTLKKLYRYVSLCDQTANNVYILNIIGLKSCSSQNRITITQHTTDVMENMCIEQKTSLIDTVTRMLHIHVIYTYICGYLLSLWPF